MPKQKSRAALERLTRNMAEHMVRHPNDSATMAHAAKLGIRQDVQDEIALLQLAAAKESV